MEETGVLSEKEGILSVHQRVENKIYGMVYTVHVLQPDLNSLCPMDIKMMNNLPITALDTFPVTSRETYGHI